MIDWRNVPPHQLPIAIPDEIVQSDDNLYDYRKPAHYYESMPDFQTLHDAINDHDCTLRELITEICPYGHIYYVVECEGFPSPLAMAWGPETHRLTEQGEKRYKALLDSEVIMHARGVLYIRYKYPERIREYVKGMRGIGDGRRYFVWG